MQEYNEIDNLFKKEAESFSPKAPDMAWDKVSSTLSKKKRIRTIKLLSIPAAASVLFVLIFGLLKNDNLGHFDYIASEKVKTEKAANDNIAKENKQTKENLIVNDNSENIAGIDNSKTKVKDKNIDKNKNNNTNSNYINAKNQTEDNLTNQKNQIAEKIKLNEGEINKPDESENSKSLIDENKIIDDINKRSQNLKYAKFKNDVYDFNYDFEVKNNPKLDYIKTFREGIFKHLSFSMVYGPSMSHRESERRDPEVIYTAYTNNERPLYNVSGGLNINYKIGDNIIISSGAHRSTIGLKGDYQTPQTDMQYLKLERFGYTSAGYYKIDQANKILAAKSENTINNVRYYDEVKASFDIVEIPLILKYKVSLRNFEIYPYAGLNASLVYNNELELSIDNEWQNLGSTEDVSNNLYGYTLGIGFNYAFNENFVLGFEPGFTKYFNSINNAEEFDSKPFILKINPVFTYKI